MGSAKTTPVSARPITKPAGQKFSADHCPKSAKFVGVLRTRIKVMERERNKVWKLYMRAKQKKDIIRMNCTHEKLVHIDNTIEQARQSLSNYLKICNTELENAKVASDVNRSIVKCEFKVMDLIKEAGRCVGEDITYNSSWEKLKIEKQKDYRTCFRIPGTFGTPRLIIANKKYVGLGLKLGAAAEYVSSWDKDGEHTNGIRGLFTVGISGLNLKGGRWGQWIMLLGLNGGVGIGTLKARDSAGVQQHTTEYTPRAGAVLHLVGFARGHITLMLKGGYLASIMKRPGENSYTTQHGGYGSIGLDFNVPKMYRYLTPEINVGYSGYQDNRNEFTTNIGIRF